MTSAEDWRIQEASEQPAPRPAEGDEGPSQRTIAAYWSMSPYERLEFGLPPRSPKADIAALLGALDAERARAEKAERERDALANALRDTRDIYGQVCENFELCEHESCRSSYSAWSLADAALARLGEGA